MSLYEIFIKSLNIYFWVFIIYYILFIFFMLTDKYQENEENAIKNGNWLNGGNITWPIFRWVLFVLSIQLT